MALSCEIFLALATFALCLSAFVSLYHFVAITFMSVCVCSNLLYCQLHFVKLLMQIFQLLQARPCHAKIPFSSPPAAAATAASLF